jgi:hypothetical protein
VPDENIVGNEYIISTNNQDFINELHIGDTIQYNFGGGLL